MAYRLLRALSNPRNRLTDAQISTNVAQRTYQPDTPHRFLDLAGEYFDYHNKSVLDIGCGCGDLCIMLAKTGVTRVTGIDIDRVRIDCARRNAEKEAVQEFLDFECTDFVKDYRSAECFDLVISLDAFEQDRKSVV